MALETLGTQRDQAGVSIDAGLGKVDLVLPVPKGLHGLLLEFVPRVVVDVHRTRVDDQPAEFDFAVLGQFLEDPLERGRRECESFILAVILSVDDLKCVVNRLVKQPRPPRASFTVGKGPVAHPAVSVFSTCLSRLPGAQAPLPMIDNVNPTAMT